MIEEDVSITYENNIFYCTKNNIKWISIDGEKWYVEEKRIAELEQQIEKMKCCYNCSKWNDGECEESPKSKTFFCADFNCKKWEIKENV